MSLLADPIGLAVSIAFRVLALRGQHPALDIATPLHSQLLASLYDIADVLRRIETGIIEIDQKGPALRQGQHLKGLDIEIPIEVRCGKCQCKPLSGIAGATVAAADAIPHQTIGTTSPR